MANPRLDVAISPTDETLDAFDPAIVSPAVSPATPARRIALVEGSSPQLADLTDDVLRGRLRVAALVLFAGFLAFFIKKIFVRYEAHEPWDWILLVVHGAVTALTGLTAALLCRKCGITHGRLRVAEWLVFGAPAIFFALSQFVTCRPCIDDGMIPAITPPWLLLIFTYAMFVPNRWQRAAAVLGAMAAVPVAMTGYLWLAVPGFSTLIEQFPHAYGGYMVETVMLMGLAFSGATVGVYTIGSLRREAYEARRLGQYRLKQRLGSGGMGEVYLAEHQLMKRPCAIKLIRPEKAGDPRVFARFEREVRSTAKLSHWNTVEIFDYGSSEDGTFYYVMEYLPGLNLTQLVERCGPMPAERVIYLMTQTCEALAEAHNQGLIHRDIKPGNIFAAHRGGMYDVAKLLDFGLVKPFGGETGSMELTQEGSIHGSPLYISPEQATGDDGTDPRTDIYSLGAVMYFLLTGQPPFDGQRPMKVLIAHVHEEVTPPSRLVAGIPDDLERVVMRCLAKRREDRYPDAVSLQNALQQCTSAGRWSREIARRWWEEHGCPKKRALDTAALEAAAV